MILGDKVIRVIKVIKVTALITLITSFTFVLKCTAQPGTIALGIEYKPIFPMSFLRTGTQTVKDDYNIIYKEGLNSGFNGGMVIRKSFTNLLSLETGISYILRNYSLSIQDTTYTESAQFSIVGYEIPVSLLAFVQTGEKTFMNAGLGISPDVFASNVKTEGENHRSYTARLHTFQPAIIANLGFEYRTEESGYLYFGASFHGPFGDDFNTTISYLQNGYERDVIIPLSGNYLTVDFRYFFPPDTKYRKKSSETEEY